MTEKKVTDNNFISRSDQAKLDQTIKDFYGSIDLAPIEITDETDGTTTKQNIGGILSQFLVRKNILPKTDKNTFASEFNEVISELIDDETYGPLARLGRQFLPIGLMLFEKEKPS